MQKLIILFFLFLLVFFSLPKAFAQDVASESSTLNLNIEYTLPYPGLLPDNPLYYLKAIRDNVLKFLISDPLKKAQFDLLQADKRLVSSKLLLEKGKTNLSITTLSKSGNYFDDAIANIEKAKRQGEDADPILSTLLTASKKHQQVIMEMEKGQKGDTLLSLKFLEVRARDFEQRVEVIQSI